MKLIEEFQDEFKNSTTDYFPGDNNDTLLISNPVNFSKVVEIVYTEILNIRTLNGINNENFYAFRVRTFKVKDK